MMYESNHTYCKNTLFRRKNLHAKIMFEVFYQFDKNINPDVIKYLTKKRGWSYSAKMVTILSRQFLWLNPKLPLKYWIKELALSEERAIGRY